MSRIERLEQREVVSKIMEANNFERVTPIPWIDDSNGKYSSPIAEIALE